MAGIGIQLANEIASIVESIGSAVVRVEGRTRGGASGSIWAPGVVLAADHALDGDEGIEIGLSGGESLAATVAGHDASLDLAVLRVQGDPAALQNQKSVEWKGVESVRVGHPIVALARPGRTTRATFGIIGALGDEWRTGAGGRVDRYVQADLSLFRGFSGGVVADLEGRVLGMGTSGLVRGAAMVLPAETLRRVVEQILTHGTPPRGFLGIGTMPVRLPASMAEKAAHGSALLVISVQSSSPAEKAGLMLGDVICGLAGRSVAHAADLVNALEELAPGRKTTAKLLRGGEPRDVDIVVGSRGA